MAKYRDGRVATDDLIAVLGIKAKGLANCDGFVSECDGKRSAPVGGFDPNAGGLNYMGNAGD